jgi:preprotein translocase subunit SecD
MSCAWNCNKPGESQLMILLQADLKDSQGSGEMERVQKILQARVRAMKLRNVEVKISSPNGLVVLAPADTDSGRLKDALTKQGLLEFRLVESKRHVGPSEQAIRDRFLSMREGYKFYPSANFSGSKIYLLKEKPDLDGWSLQDARVMNDSTGNPCVAFSFTREGSERFGVLTERNINRQIAIMVDGKVFSAPIIKTKITGSGQVTGNFSEQEARDLAAILKVGPQMVPLAVMEEKVLQPLAK